MQAAVIIPARYASTRLPGKPLLDRTGKPLIVHVAEQAAKAKLAKAVIVATDDQRIADAVQAHGYTAVMTRADHPNGSSRIAEAASGLPKGFEIIVNVQGDEPEIDPAVIDRLIERIKINSEMVATVVCPFSPGEDVTNPNVVKVVLSQAGRCLYFSRSVIPHRRDDQSDPPGYFKHLGIYAYRRHFLELYARLSPTPAEQAEQLEQLRILEHGHAIGAIGVERAHQGIDTPEQYEAFVKRSTEH
jgi:3-deoxy-manno-octulosonate cytidylyltransferase (CMP-KDO synthetase)